jgi:hypothetical protein
VLFRSITLKSGNFGTEDFFSKAAADRLVVAITEAHPLDAVQLMCAALDDLGPPSPEYAFLLERIRADADFWAEFASPLALEAHLAAILRVLGKTAFGLPARKRLMVLFWNSLTPPERAAFVDRVASGPKLR